MPQKGRSLLALFAGFVVVVALSIGADVVMHAAHVFPPWGQPVGDTPLLLAAAYRAVFGIIGSYITARLAPYAPMKHALVGGCIGIVLGTLGAIATWNAGPAFGGHWYPITLILMALPQAWTGAKLREMQLPGEVQT